MFSSFTHGTQPLLRFNFYKLFLDRWIVTVLMIRSVAAVAEHDHVIARAVTTMAYFAYTSFRIALV